MHCCPAPPTILSPSGAFLAVCPNQVCLPALKKPGLSTRPLQAAPPGPGGSLTTAASCPVSPGAVRVGLAGLPSLGQGHACVRPSSVTVTAQPRVESESRSSLPPSHPACCPPAQYTLHGACGSFQEHRGMRAERLRAPVTWTAGSPPWEEGCVA